MSIYYKKNRRDRLEWCEHYGKQESKSIKFIRRQLINKSGAVCAICGREIKSMGDCTIDHIVPKSKGGLTTIDNCRLAHRDCNERRGNKCEN